VIDLLRIPQPPAQSGFLPFGTRDFAEAYPEALLQRAGVRPAQNPIASDIVSRAPSFGDIAKHFIAGSFGTDELRAMPASVAIQYATRASVSYGTADFSATISTALAAATYAAFDATTAGFSRCLRSISVKNFLPQSVAAFSVSPLEKMAEHSEWPRALIQSSRLRAPATIIFHSVEICDLIGA